MYLIKKVKILFFVFSILVLNFQNLNSLENKDTCFESFKNKITIIDNHNTINFDLKSKKLVAKDIVNHIIKTK